MTESEKAFEFFDFDIEEAAMIDAALTARRERDGRICICGHAMSKHSNTYGPVNCKPTRMQCKCRQMRAVLETNDVRVFLRKTSGQGPMHALGRGLQAAIANGNTVEWIIPQECDKCHTPGPISPVPINMTVTGPSVASEETGYNALLCKTCRTGNTLTAVPDQQPES